jgi:hypothetical protein
MLYLSELLMRRQHEMQSFDDLVVAVREEARQTGERFFKMDTRPPFADTPQNWEDRLEAAFY